MRILHIDTEMTWRGGENQLRLLLEGLASTAIESHVAVRPGSAAAARLKTKARIYECPMRGGMDPGAGWRLARYCKVHAIDLADAHTSNAHSLALLASLFYPKLKIVVHRRVDYEPKRDLMNRLKYESARINRYVAISEAIKQVLVGWGLPASRISVVKSAVEHGKLQGLDRESCRAQLAKTYGIEPNKTFIGSAAALTPQKGHDVLLHAAAELKRRGVPFHVFIAGEGELTNPLEKLRIELGLEHDVTFMGFITDVARLLGGLDVMAVPSNFEGLGTVILDAIGAGLPVVATRVGGIPEIIKHGDTGMLSEKGDAKGLADNLEALVRAPALRMTLNTQARSWIDREFSVKAMVGGNLDVYRELLGKAH